MKNSGLLECNGAKIYYETLGSGEPIVFVHGMALDNRMWRTQVEYFSKNFLCITYDMRGFGKSSPLDGSTYSMPADLVCLLDFLGLDKVNLVGLSRGGRMVSDFVVTYPDKVKTLTLVDAHIEGIPIHEGYGVFKKSTRKAILEGGDQAAKEAWANAEIFAPIMAIPGTSAEFMAMLQDFVPAFWREANTEIDPEILPAELLHTISCPTLIIVGEKDLEHFKIVAQIAHEKIPNSEYKMIPNAGHMANMEAPEVFNQLFEDFLSKH